MSYWNFWGFHFVQLRDVLSRWMSKKLWKLDTPNVLPQKSQILTWSSIRSSDHPGAHFELLAPGHPKKKVRATPAFSAACLAFQKLSTASAFSWLTKPVPETRTMFWNIIMLVAPILGSEEEKIWVWFFSKNAVPCIVRSWECVFFGAVEMLKWPVYAANYRQRLTK